MKTKRIGDILIEEGMITQEQLEQALERQRETSQSLGATLVELGALSEEVLYHFLALQHGMEFLDVQGISVAPELLKLCPEAVARKLKIFPIQKEGRKLKIVTSAPENANLLYLDYQIVVPPDTEFEIALTKETDLFQLIDRHFPKQQKGKSLEETLKELEITEAAENELEVLQDRRIGAEETEEDGALSVEEGPMIRMCNFILDDAIGKRASDIHINPYDKKLVLRYRIDGSLIEFPAPPLYFKRAISSRYKIMARLDPMERRKPQDGRIKYKFQDRSVDLRVSIVPSIWGENVVMRIIDQGVRKLNMQEMNFLPAQLEIFRAAYNQPYGMILVTGPTGCGKTTTLYALLAELNDPLWNIQTVEDPVEYRLPHIIQCQVNPAIGLNFASILRSFLRQDPDIIMVGEIRDRETANIAVKASMTGHLVISTLHTSDAPSTILRLVDLGVDPMYVGSSVLAVCSQKLVRKVCQNCQQPYTPTAEDLLQLGCKDEDLIDGTFFKGQGCMDCHKTGYKDRIAIHEVLSVNSAVRQAIFERVNLNKLKNIARQSRMQTLREVALIEWKRGVTTLEEVLAETPPDR